jgi:hypothetical protein
MILGRGLGDLGPVQLADFRLFSLEEQQILRGLNQWLVQMLADPATGPTKYRENPAAYLALLAQRSPLYTLSEGKLARQAYQLALANQRSQGRTVNPNIYEFLLTLLDENHNAEFIREVMGITRLPDGSINWQNPKLFNWKKTFWEHLRDHAELDLNGNFAHDWALLAPYLRQFWPQDWVIEFKEVVEIVAKVKHNGRWNLVTIEDYFSMGPNTLTNSAIMRFRQYPNNFP